MTFAKEKETLKKMIITFILIFGLVLSMQTANSFTIFEDLNVTGNGTFTGNVTVNGNYLCDNTLCYLISDFNASGSATGTVTQINVLSPYMIPATITTTGNVDFNETKLNETIDSRTTNGTVTSVSGDGTYVTGTITTSGS